MWVFRYKIVLVAFSAISWCGCGQLIKDANIKKMLVSGNKSEAAFAGVNYLIENGVVTLIGNCPSQKERSKVEGRVRHVSGVQKVVNNLVVAPVVLDGDFPLKQAADSALVRYPLVLADVQDSVIHVHGTAKQEELQPLTEALDRLQPKRVQINLSAK